MTAYRITYGTPSGEVFHDERVAPTPEDAAWLTARDLPRETLDDPGLYILLNVTEAERSRPPVN